MDTTRTCEEVRQVQLNIYHMNTPGMYFYELTWCNSFSFEIEIYFGSRTHGGATGNTKLQPDLRLISGLYIVCTKSEIF